jgi:hypothetical protein
MQSEKTGRIKKDYTEKKTGDPERKKVIRDLMIRMHDIDRLSLDGRG